MIKRFYPTTLRSMMQSGDPGNAGFYWQATQARAALLAPNYQWAADQWDVASWMAPSMVATATVVGPYIAMDNVNARANLMCASISFGEVAADYRYVLIYSGSSATTGRPLVLLDHEVTVSPGGSGVVVDIDPAAGLASFGMVA